MKHSKAAQGKPASSANPIPSSLSICGKIGESLGADIMEKFRFHDAQVNGHVEPSSDKNQHLENAKYPPIGQGLVVFVVIVTGHSEPDRSTA
jgi:hypothetical protein